MTDCAQCVVHAARFNRRLCWRCQDARDQLRDYWRDLGREPAKCIVCGTPLSHRQVSRGVDFCTHGCWSAWKTGRHRTDQSLVKG